MSTPRRMTRSFRAKRNSEPGYQSSAWDSGLPPQYMPSVAPSIHQQQQPPPLWREPRPRRRPSLISAPFGTWIWLPQVLVLGLLFGGCILKTRFPHLVTPCNSITPAAPRDFGWIEYIPHACISRLSSAQKGGFSTGDDDDDDDIAFALSSPQHAAFATAAWRVFSATDANANWTDPRKTQPTAAESLACRAQVGAEHARLAAIWNPLRADYINSTDPSDTRLLDYRKPLLGGLSGAQLRVVDAVLRVAYRDALFLCMTLKNKKRWLAILEGNEVPDSAYFFPVDVDESDAVKEGEDAVLRDDDAKVGGGEAGSLDEGNTAVSGEHEKADGDNATWQGWSPREKEL